MIRAKSLWLVLSLGWVFVFSARAQTNFQRLLSFSTNPPVPQQQMFEGSDGLIYGTCMSGGQYGDGFVFRIAKSGNGYTVLHSFTNDDSYHPEGMAPVGLLENTNDGLLYGVDYLGGQNGLGTIFKLDKAGGNFSVIYQFGLGDNPNGLILASDGSFYGVTAFGGRLDEGTLFRFDANGVVTYLHSFGWNDSTQQSVAEPGRPRANIVEGPDGAFYGTTPKGGTIGAGSIFKINKDGSGCQILYSFAAGTTDGSVPEGAMIVGTDQVLYGTTPYVAGTNIYGTIFRINPDGTGYSVIHYFDSTQNQRSVGYRPQGHPYALCEGPDHALYGITEGDFTNTLGLIYRVEKTGSNFTVLHTFSGPDGAGPTPGLCLASDGGFYGLTAAGGASSGGTFYKVFASPPVIAFSGMQSGSSSVTLNLSGGAAGQSLNIQATADPSNTNGWSVIGSATAAVDGTFQFTDTNAPNYSARFYRGAAQ